MIVELTEAEINHIIIAVGNQVFRDELNLTEMVIPAEARLFISENNLVGKDIIDKLKYYLSMDYLDEVENANN